MPSRKIGTAGRSVSAMQDLQPLRAFAFAVQGEQDRATVPDRIHVLPAGDVVEGRDERRFRVDDLDRLAEASLEGGEPIRVDIDHHSLLPWETTEAYGWIDAFERDDDGLWALVEWTDEGRELIASRKYRALSPVVMIQPPAEGEAHAEGGGLPLATRIESVALTNTPNLRMQWLNSTERTHAESNNGDKMHEDLITLAATFGIDASSESELAAALHTRLTPAPQTDMVPREDLAHAMTRLDAATSELADIKAQAHRDAVDAAIDKGRREGKIAPASVEKWRAMCVDAAGLEQFCSLVATLPVIVSSDAHSDESAPVAELDSHTLSPVDEEILERIGVSVEDFLAFRKGA
jgi:phage I-like protein